MTPRQRQTFLQGLVRNGIAHKEHHGGEVSILCPNCSPAHDNKRQTLSINTNNDRWQCFRCPTLKGRKTQIGRLLDTLRLNHLLPVFEEDEVVIEDDTLAKIKNRMLYGHKKEVSTLSPTELPEGYRTDWTKSLIGESLLVYLTKKRKLSIDDIIKYKIGYIVKGKYSGCVVLPVYMEGKLRFWQVRRVLMVGNSPKYDSPSIERNAVLFGYDSITTKTLNIVEGIFDAIALGDGTVGLLSKAISEQQIALLAKKSVEIVRVILDGEAWNECKQVAYMLSKNLWTAKKITAYRLPFGNDPGKLGRAALENPTEILTLRA